LTILLTILISTKKIQSQTTVGIQTLGSYASGRIDQISESDLGVHIDIPLYQHGARGNGLGTTVHLIYDSGYANGNNPLVDLGWRLVLGTAKPGTVVVTQNSKEWSPLCDPGVTHCNIGYYSYTYSFEFTDASGHTHQFMDGSSVNSVQCVGSNPNLPCSNVYLSVSGNAYDNSGYFLLVNNGVQSATPSKVTVTTPSGEVYGNPGAGFSDPNGNAGIISNGVSAGGYWVDWSTTLTDDANVSATITGGAYSSSNYTNWTSRHPLVVQYHDTSGTPQSITVNYELQTIGYSCSSGFSFSQHVALVQSVVYPDGTSYGFTYTSTGALESIQLPTGGTITYTGNLGLAASCGVGLPANLTRTTSDGSTTYAQTVNSTQPGNTAVPATSTTTVSHPDGSSEKINFVYVADFDSTSNTYNKYTYETYHAWSSAQGSLLKSTMRCYNSATGTCTVTPITLPIAQIATTTTLDNGQTSKTVRQMNSVGLTTELDEYDYGVSSPTRKAVTAYASLGNHIVDRPSSIIIYDGSGNTVSKTTFGYDEYTITAMTLPGHNTISGARGNLTSRHVWLSTTSGMLDSHLQYDDAGQVVGAQDPRQYWTYYGYDSATDYCRTGTTPPTPSSGVSQATSASCDSNTGLPASTTDANGVKTSYSYDEMLRPSNTAVTTSSGTTAANTSISYSGPSLPEAITTTVTATPNPNQISTITLDGLGRTVAAVGTNGATVSTTYNSMGYVKSVTNPYFSTSDSTYGITSYLYDGLGRKTYQCQPDNGTTNSTTCSPANSYQSWVYAGNSVTFKDEAGNQWENWTDALGRLTEVMEPNGSSKAPSMETDYAYDALNDLLSVMQWGGPHGSSGARSRSFSYDSVSRLTQSYNPETGWICYGTTGGAAPNGSNCTPGYDANGNLSSKTDGRGVTTTYSYDTLNRLTSKSYSDGVTSTVLYGYDGSSLGFVPVPSDPSRNLHVTLTNTVGRMYFASVTGTLNPGGASLYAYSYDSMGRIVNQWLSTPSYNTGTSPVFEISATYNFAGGRISLNNSASRTFNYTYDSAGRLQSASHTVTLGGTPVTTPMISSASYFPSGQPKTLTTNTGTATVTGTWGSDNRLRVTSYTNLSTANSANTNYGYALTYIGTNNVNTAAETAYQQGVGSKSWTWTYNYDTLNRLANATSAGAILYGCVETYDPFGNRTSQAPFGGTGHSCTSMSTQVSSSNRLSGASYNYDAAGNMLSDGTNALTYDGEGRIATSANAGRSTTYIYGPDGQRISKISGGIETDYIRDIDSSLLATYVGGNYFNQPQELWVGSKHFGTVTVPTGNASQTQNFSLTNWLGSEAARTNAANGIPSSAYLSQPFGDFQTTLFGSDTDDIHYTGKERDTESGNDYFGARYYASTMGRMLSPDPIGIWVADKTNPQSWNLYSYVMNNPLKFIDPSGEECVWDDGSYDAADDKQTGSAKGCSGQGGTWVDPNLFQSVEGNQAGSWSGQGSSQIKFDWLTPSATAFGGPNAAQQEVNDVVSGFFTGKSPQNIEYLPQDPFTLSFQKSAGMDAINAKIAANCSATSGKLAVGSGEAFVNTLIDGIAGGQGFDTPEAQLGAFNATWTRDGGTVAVTVTNPISLNSAAYHATTKVGIQNPTSGPMSTVNQTLHIQAGDPCY
jgi:RHS repeat-associated protein